ncbi:MAG: hypothetical protein MJ123_01460 [Lachnospiraceae bacterium]|nr:hypothetical protein [Lachnospiraceae bacterium]
MKYEKPVVLNNDDIFEGVYAQSNEGGYESHFKVVNNDSGSLSVVEIAFELALDHPGERIKVTIAYNGPGYIEKINDVSGFEFSLAADGKSFTFDRKNHYNANERIVFNVNEMKFSERADGTPDGTLNDGVNNGNHGSLYQHATNDQNVDHLFAITSIEFL